MTTSQSVQAPAAAPSPLHRFLRFFFDHFYHGFAWTYDMVAAVVSIGRWNRWVACAVPYAQGRTLELGHGPGQLQKQLRRVTGLRVMGLDESVQMGRLAMGRLRRAGASATGLVRGLAQNLPFEAGSMDTIISTFPSEYIFAPETLREVQRVLAPTGRMVVIPAAWITGGHALDRAAAWLFRVTDQAPRLPADIVGKRLRSELEGAGFRTEFHTEDIQHSQVLVILARKADQA